MSKLLIKKIGNSGYTYEIFKHWGDWNKIDNVSYNKLTELYYFLKNIKKDDALKLAELVDVKRFLLKTPLMNEALMEIDNRIDDFEIISVNTDSLNALTKIIVNDCEYHLRYSPRNGGCIYTMLPYLAPTKRYVRYSNVKSLAKKIIKDSIIAKDKKGFNYVYRVN